MEHHVFIILPLAESKHLAEVIHRLVPIDRMHGLGLRDGIIRLGEIHARQLLNGATKAPHAVPFDQQLLSLMTTPLTVFRVKGGNVREHVKSSGLDMEHIYIYEPSLPDSEPANELERLLYASFKNV